MASLLRLFDSQEKTAVREFTESLSKTFNAKDLSGLVNIIIFHANELSRNHNGSLSERLLSIVEVQQKFHEPAQENSDLALSSSISRKATPETVDLTGKMALFTSAQSERIERLLQMRQANPKAFSKALSSFEGRVQRIIQYTLDTYQPPVNRVNRAAIAAMHDGLEEEDIQEAIQGSGFSVEAVKEHTLALGNKVPVVADLVGDDDL